MLDNAIAPNHHETRKCHSIQTASSIEQAKHVVLIRVNQVGREFESAIETEAPHHQTAEATFPQGESNYEIEYAQTKSS